MVTIILLSTENMVVEWKSNEEDPPNVRGLTLKISQVSPKKEFSLYIFIYNDMLTYFKEFVS